MLRYDIYARVCFHKTTNEQDFTNRDFLEIQSDLLNRFYKYPCSF